jgi:hypothetical protein
LQLLPSQERLLKISLAVSFDRIVMIVYMDEAYIALTGCLFIRQLQMERTEVRVLIKGSVLEFDD